MASYNPKLAVGAGGLTLVAAAFYKKGWSWWIVGVLILALGLFFQWNHKNEMRLAKSRKGTLSFIKSLDNS